MKKNWLTTYFPFLFKIGPDDCYYLWFIKYITYIDNNGVLKVYCFETKETYIKSDYCEFQIRYGVSQEKEKHEIRIRELEWSKENLSSDILLKIEQIRLIEQKNNELNTELLKLMNYKTELEGELIALKEVVKRIEKENGDIKEFFEKENKSKNDTIESLRMLVNCEREKGEKERAKIQEQYLNSIEALRKQIEYLDNDFIDVAKAMKIFNSRESKPLKGFRIKLD